MRKLLLGLVALLAIATPIVLTATPAQADPGSPRCMTKAEWYKIKEGQRRATVTRITGITGKVNFRSYSSDGSVYTSVDYRQCLRTGKPASRWSTVTIDFDTFDWDNWYDTGIPHVDYKGSWSTPSRW